VLGRKPHFFSQKFEIKNPLCVWALDLKDLSFNGSLFEKMKNKELIDVFFIYSSFIQGICFLIV